MGRFFYSYPYIHAPTDDVRHDVYLTMVSGVFNKGTKRADKNVEINVEILDDRDIVIPVCAVCCVLCAVCCVLCVVCCVLCVVCCVLCVVCCVLCVSWVVSVCMLIVHASYCTLPVWLPVQVCT